MPVINYAIVAAAVADHPREAPRLSRMAGFSGVLLDAWWNNFDITSLSQSGRRELKHVLVSHNQQLAAVRTDLGSKGFSPGGDVDHLLWRLDRIMEAAAGLQAPLVCVDLGPLPTPMQQARPKPRITPEQAGLIIIPTLAAAPAPESTTLPSIPTQVDPNFVSQVDGALADLGQRADRYGVRLALRSELSSFAALERVLRQANCPWFGIDLDPVAVLRDEWSMNDIFSQLGPLIYHVRARDAASGTSHRTQPAAIGEGHVKWRELMSDLDGAGYAGWITIDPVEMINRPAAAGIGLRYLKQLA